MLLSPSFIFLLVASGIGGLVLLVFDSVARNRRRKALEAGYDEQSLLGGAPLGALKGKLIGVAGSVGALIAFLPFALAKNWSFVDLMSSAIFTLMAIVFVGGVVGVWGSRRLVASAVAMSAAAAFFAGLYWISHQFRDRNPDGIEKAFRDMFVVVFAMPSSVGCGALLWWLVYTFRSAKR